MKMRPVRQIEVAELMGTMNRYTEGYVRALLAATPRAKIITEAKPKATKGLTEDQKVLLERESSQLDREVKLARLACGADHLLLVVVRRYLARLLENPRIVRFLTQQRPEFLTEFRRIVEIDTMAA